VLQLTMTFCKDIIDSASLAVALCKDATDSASFHFFYFSFNFLKKHHQRSVGVAFSCYANHNFKTLNLNSK
jgi:hypothetical protein